jgi:hypothetical protein
MALNDVVRDTRTGEEFVVTWSGAMPLIEHDPRYVRQRSSATDYYTRGAVINVGLMARHTKFRASIKGQD